MSTMLSTKMTFDDKRRLSRLRNERLRCFFAQSLLHCVFHRNDYNILIIHCSEASMVESILTDLEELCDYSWLILGTEAIALYFAEEEIRRVEYSRVYGA